MSDPNYPIDWGDDRLECEICCVHLFARGQLTAIRRWSRYMESAHAHAPLDGPARKNLEESRQAVQEMRARFWDHDSEFHPERIDRFRAEKTVDGGSLRMLTAFKPLLRMAWCGVAISIGPHPSSPQSMVLVWVR